MMNTIPPLRYTDFHRNASVTIGFHIVFRPELHGQELFGDLNIGKVGWKWCFGLRRCPVIEPIETGKAEQA